MDKSLYDNYVAILKEELVPALGCTEPIAVAYCAAKAREVLGMMPSAVRVYCSGNIIKNVKGVTVPNSGGMKGIEAAAMLGCIGGNPERKLEVLSDVTPEQIAETKKCLDEKMCACFLKENTANLYIRVEMENGDESAAVTIEHRHTQITSIEKNHKIIFSDKGNQVSAKSVADKSKLDVEDIITFANEVRIEDIRDVIQRQIELNTAISNEGLKHHYGAEVGKTLLKFDGNTIKNRAKARAAAGSDARMNGCPLPVVINSGSGNQGITCSLPVIEFAAALNVSEEKLYRALVLSNLIALHQKYYIGNLSAYCGAVSAACGAGAAITYLYGGDYKMISRTITNTLANVSGIICDGAKSSCAAKIASAVDAAIMAHCLGESDHAFAAGDGIVKKDVEDTIRGVGYIGKEGMKNTDVTVLNWMIDRVGADKS